MTDELPRTYSLVETARALGMSTRWVRERIRLDNVEHIRFGKTIKFTEEQYQALRTAHTKAPLVESITTGRKKKSA